MTTTLRMLESASGNVTPDIRDRRITELEGQIERLTETLAIVMTEQREQRGKGYASYECALFAEHMIRLANSQRVLAFCAVFLERSQSGEIIPHGKAIVTGRTSDVGATALLSEVTKLLNGPGPNVTANYPHRTPPG